MHSFYSSSTQPYVYAHYTIFLAEVASTVNESLLVNYMLNTEQDPARRMYLINHYLDEFRGTVFRQTMFAEFERWTHEMVEQGATLTPALLNEKYYQLNVDYHGPDMTVTMRSRSSGTHSHFYRAFTSTSTPLVFQLRRPSASKSAEGRPAAERYIDFLRSGSSDYSINLLRRAGVDMTTPDPIRRPWTFSANCWTGSKTCCSAERNVCRGAGPSLGHGDGPAPPLGREGAGSLSRQRTSLSRT